MDFEEKNNIITGYLKEFRSRFFGNTNSFIISELESYKEAVHSEIIYELSLEIKAKNKDKLLNVSEMNEDIARQISDIQVGPFHFDNNIAKKSELKEVIEQCKDIIDIMEELHNVNTFHHFITGNFTSTESEKRNTILQKLTLLSEHEYFGKHSKNELYEIYGDYKKAYIDRDHYHYAQQKLNKIISSLENEVTQQKPNNITEICEAYSDYFRQCLQTYRLFMENLNIV